MHLLEVDSIQKSYNGKVILSDVFLHCKTGDIIGITGRNGSGKSTLLHIIFGTTLSDNKFIRLDGKVLKNTYRNPNGISLLPQHDFIPKYFSVKQTIQLFLNDKDTITSFIKDTFLQTFLSHKISMLSKGELKYLAAKLILFDNTKFCLLDEPYTGISPLVIEKINALILQKSSEKGIIITDHNHNALSKIITSKHRLENGVLYKV